MERFNYLKKQRAKALRIFEDAKVRLNEVTVQLNNEITKSITSIEARRKEIESEEQAINFARAELASTTKTIVKINEILV